MIEATIEDLVFTIRSSRETIWGHPQIVGEDVLSTIKIFTGAKPFLKAYIKPFGIPEMEMLTISLKGLEIMGKKGRLISVWKNTNARLRLLRFSAFSTSQ